MIVIQLKSVRGSFDIPENPNTLPNTKHLLIEFKFGSWEKIQSAWVLNWNLGGPKLQLYVTRKCSAYDVSCIGPNPQLVRETNFICTSLIRPMFQTCGSHTRETHMSCGSHETNTGDLSLVGDTFYKLSIGDIYLVKREKETEDDFTSLMPNM